MKTPLFLRSSVALVALGLAAVVVIAPAQLMPRQPPKPFPGTEPKAEPDKPGAETKPDSQTKPEAEEAGENLVKGGVKWEFAKGSENWDGLIRRRIERAMNEAVSIYNKHSKLRKKVTVNYSPGVPTAEGNISGWISFGGQISTRTALHEIAHTIGVGTHPRWGDNMKDGRWTGKHAVALLKEFDGDKAELRGDRQHFWPYGLNYDNERTGKADQRHVELVAAMLKDMGGPP